MLDPDHGHGIGDDHGQGSDDHHDDHGHSSVFRLGVHADLQLISAFMVAIIVFTTLFEHGLRAVERKLRFFDKAFDEATLELVTKLKDELMILGTLSFLLTVTVQTAALKGEGIPHDVLLPFEFAHVLIFLSAVLLVAVDVNMIFILRDVKRQAAVADWQSLDELQQDYRLASSRGEVSVVRRHAEHLAISRFFRLTVNLTPDFDFSLLLGYTLNELVGGMLEIDPVSWALAVLYFLGLIAMDQGCFLVVTCDEQGERSLNVVAMVAPGLFVLLLSGMLVWQVLQAKTRLLAHMRHILDHSDSQRPSRRSSSPGGPPPPPGGPDATLSPSRRTTGSRSSRYMRRVDAPRDPSATRVRAGSREEHEQLLHERPPRRSASEPAALRASKQPPAPTAEPDPEQREARVRETVSARDASLERLFELLADLEVEAEERGASSEAPLTLRQLFEAWNAKDHEPLATSVHYGSVPTPRSRSKSPPRAASPPRARGPSFQQDKQRRGLAILKQLSRQLSSVDSVGWDPCGWKAAARMRKRTAQRLDKLHEFLGEPQQPPPKARKRRALEEQFQTRLHENHHHVFRGGMPPWLLEKAWDVVVLGSAIHLALSAMLFIPVAFEELQLPWAVLVAVLLVLPIFLVFTVVAPKLLLVYSLVLTVTHGDLGTFRKALDRSWEDKETFDSLRHSMLSEYNVDTWARAYELLDVDDSGCLTPEEIHSLMSHAIGSHWSFDSTIHLVRKLDRNQDQEISREDFRGFLEPHKAMV